MIRKVKGGYRVVAESGPRTAFGLGRSRNMGTYRSKKAAEKRLRQIEVFKHMEKQRRVRKAKLKR